MKILFLTHHWNRNTHHSGHSGYQELIKYMALQHQCAVVTLGSVNQVSIENGVEVHYVKPRMRKDLFFVKRLTVSNYARKMQKDYDVVHAVYSDCGFFQKHPHFFSTLHISPRVSRGEDLLSRIFLRLKYYLIEKRVFANSQLVFVVSTNLFGSLTSCRHKAVYLPHGVNTTYWTPHEKVKGIVPELPGRYALCVGNNGLDKDLLLAVIKNNPEVDFVIVGLRNFETNLHNVLVMNNVAETTLKEIYNNCNLFIRPMMFATANNSILEAMAMNKPVLISTPDGIYDYFNSNCESLKVVASDGFLQTFSKTMDNINETHMSFGKDSVRQYTVEKFDWNVIVNELTRYYNNDR